MPPGARDYAELLRELGSTEYSQLRPAQAAALGSYASDFAETKDVSLELPTGAGKSLIALLVGEAWRQEGRSVAILTANKALARQMEDHGGRLGVRIVRFEGAGSELSVQGRRDYNRANAVAVMNYWVYFNQSPTVDSADLLVMDDAHLAENALESLFSVGIDRYAHPALFARLMQELDARFGDYASVQDALDDRPGYAGTELLSFLDQLAFEDRLREVIDGAVELGTDTDLSYRWGRVRGRLRESNIYVSSRSTWVRPFVFPLQANGHYADPEQRIYMSATVGDPADLARRLGTAPIMPVAIDDEHAHATYGRRLVVINSDNELFGGRTQGVLRKTLENLPKSLWLCASHADAEEIRTLFEDWLGSNAMGDHPTWRLSSEGPELEQFKQAPAGHLFAAGRFDGMDFSANECRLVVLASQPRAINAQEEFVRSYLRDAHGGTAEPADHPVSRPLQPKRG